MVWHCYSNFYVCYLFMANLILLINGILNVEERTKHDCCSEKKYLAIEIGISLIFIVVGTLAIIFVEILSAVDVYNSFIKS